MSGDAPSRPRPQDRRCPSCGSDDLVDGFLEDTGEHSKGFVRWIAGPLETGRRGRAKISESKPRWIVDSSRCLLCGHVSLFANRRA